MATPTIKDLLTTPPTWPTSRIHLISSCPPTPFPHVRFTWHMFTRRTNHAATQDAVAVPGAAQRVRDERQTRRTDMFLDSLPRCGRSGALADALRGSKRRLDRVCQSAPHRVVQQGQVVRGGVRRSFARGMRNRSLACHSVSTVGEEVSLHSVRRCISPCSMSIHLLYLQIRVTVVLPQVFTSQ
jgi:hypothetical protein